MEKGDYTDGPAVDEKTEVTTSYRPQATRLNEQDAVTHEPTHELLKRMGVDGLMHKPECSIFSGSPSGDICSCGTSAAAAAQRLGKRATEEQEKVINEVLRGIDEPRIVTLCGSTRYRDFFESENQRLTLEGAIVISIGVDMRKPHAAWSKQVPCTSCRGVQGQVVICDKCAHTGKMTVIDEALIAEVKAKLDALHLKKIDMSTEVHVINMDGYVGESTAREIRHAIAAGKRLTWLYPNKVPAWVLAEDQTNVA